MPPHPDAEGRHLRMKFAESLRWDTMMQKGNLNIKRAFVCDPFYIKGKTTSFVPDMH